MSLLKKYNFCRGHVRGEQRINSTIKHPTTVQRRRRNEVAKPQRQRGIKGNFRVWIGGGEAPPQRQKESGD